MAAPPPPTPYRFSNEEMKVLQECNRESFYQRCLPFSTIFGVGTYMGVQSGHIKPNQKYGATPKVIGAVALGYILGKMSYQMKCAEKLMALPDSKMGAILRSKRFGGSNQDTLTLEDGDLDKVITDVPESEKFSDISNRSALDLDIDRPLSSGLDDFRPNLDDIRIDDGLLPIDSSRTTSYDELRRRNREDYEQKRTKPYRGVVLPEDIPSGLKPFDNQRDNETPRSSKPTNIYGDFWEK